MRGTLRVRFPETKLSWKVVLLDAAFVISDYRFHDRDYSVPISTQVSKLLEDYSEQYPGASYRICSSANGGLRIGIVCLTERFSGRIASNLALAAGGNVIFTTTVDSPGNDLGTVDALVVVGGVDCPDVANMKIRIEQFDPDDYLFRTLIYAGNIYLSEDFLGRYPQAHLVGNPMGAALSGWPAPAATRSPSSAHASSAGRSSPDPRSASVATAAATALAALPPIPAANGSPFRSSSSMP